VPRVARAEIQRLRVGEPDQPVRERRHAAGDCRAGALQHTVVITQQIIRRAVVEVDEELNAVARRIDGTARDDGEESNDQEAHCRPQREHADRLSR
jgi:hypothetical protein